MWASKWFWLCPRASDSSPQMSSSEPPRDSQLILPSKTGIELTTEQPQEWSHRLYSTCRTFGLQAQQLLLHKKTLLSPWSSQTPPPNPPPAHTHCVYLKRRKRRNPLEKVLVPFSSRWGKNTFWTILAVRAGALICEACSRKSTESK